MGSNETGTRIGVVARDTQALRALTRETASWSTRLYGSLKVVGVSPETHAALASALGEVGVEAEHYLHFVTAFVTVRRPSRGAGALFLDNLLAYARRMPRVATTLEIATQSYLSAIESAFPGIRQTGAHADVWWQERSSFALPGEPLELCLRRCGYSLRHVIGTHLASNVEAIAEQMSLFQHALVTLPPAGIAPVHTLYAGLNELASQLGGYVIPNHIEDQSVSSPGLVTSIHLLRQLDAREGADVDADIVWARAQYAFVRSTTLQSAGLPWANTALREWASLISELEAIRQRAVDRR